MIIGVMNSECRIPIEHTGALGLLIYTFSGEWAPGPGFLVVSPGISFLPNIEYSGCFCFVELGGTTLYLAGPGVLAKSSSKPLIIERPVIEYAAAAFLLMILGPCNWGNE